AGQLADGAAIVVRFYQGGIERQRLGIQPVGLGQPPGAVMGQGVGIDELEGGGHGCTQSQFRWSRKGGRSKGMARKWRPSQVYRRAGSGPRFCPKYIRVGWISAPPMTGKPTRLK